MLRNKKNLFIVEGVLRIQSKIYWIGQLKDCKLKIKLIALKFGQIS